ncbi:glycosyltransferase family 61 protein [Sedimentitalea sp.]|uniref:glycosyltransferase family 61 protein n=1 Tax=Sedimentitalea sp. TaxID=2048915 RepID=UPI003298AD29
MISFRPLQGKLCKLMRCPVPDLLARSEDRWEVAPGSEGYAPPAVFLPEQIERIRDTEFAPIDEVVQSFRGGFGTYEGPTVAHRFRYVDLVDGVLYANGYQRHLRPRLTRSLTYRRPDETLSGTMYESWVGNRWFGNWLSDDCLTYMLAAAVGQPVTTAPDPTGHVPHYESLLGMAARRLGDVHFDELVLFEDLANNSGKAQRAWAMREKLLHGRKIDPLPGVFLLRGKSGDARVLENERQIAENMAETYGFKVLDPAHATVDQIADVCGQAAIIAGVEGSHLVHGLAMMPPRATLFVIQPPDRTVAALKIVTDRQDQRYAFVVAEGSRLKFRANWSEIKRTLDLLH